MATQRKLALINQLEVYSEGRIFRIWRIWLMYVYYTPCLSETGRDSEV